MQPLGVHRIDAAGQSLDNDPQPRTEWVAVVGPGVVLDDEFAPAVRAALSNAPVGTCLFTDFRVGETVVQVGDWSLERSRWQDYTGPVLVVPTTALRPGEPVDRAQLLRAAPAVRHLAKPLYRAASDDVRPLDRGQRAVAVAGLGYRWDQGRRRLTGPAPTTSIVIPTRLTADRRGVLLDRCLASLPLADEHLEVVVVLDADVAPDRMAPWHATLGSRLTVRQTPLPFNFAHKINEGVAAAGGDLVVLLNDDIVAADRSWLDELTAIAGEPTVGATGPVLRYPDGTVQHRGHAFSRAGVQLVDVGAAHDDPGPRRRNQADRDVTGVTAACLVQRKDVWQHVGGMNEEFPVAFNDVDYCERIRAAGLRVVLCNNTALHHHESATRRGSADQAEVDRLAARWPDSWGHPDPLTPDVEPPAERTRWQRLRDRARPHRPGRPPA